MEKGESKKRGGTTCCVPLCHSNSMKNANLSFHKIPVKAGSRETWMNLLSITKEPLRSHKVCSLHFPDGKKLYGTLPTAFIPSTRQTEKCRDRGTETNCAVNDNISSQDEPETSGGQSLEESYIVFCLQDTVLEEKYKQCVLRLEHVLSSDTEFKFFTSFQNYSTFKVSMQLNFQVGDNNINVMFDIASLDCESLRTNNEIEVCLFSV